MKKIILLTIVSLVFGCNYHSTNAPGPGNSGLSTTPEPTNPGDPGATTPAEPTVRFADVKTNVFDTSCTSCHESRGLSLNFSSYTNVSKYLTKIRNDVFVNRSMPPSGDLTTLQKQILQTWLNSGAPE